MRQLILGDESAAQDQMMNILVLGPTGVGKSTFINAFYNYLSYDAIEDALRGGVKVAIPTKFTVFNRSTKSHEDVEIGDNSVGEESFVKRGESSTRQSKGHIFPLDGLAGEQSIRIIDTPGVGDTRGIEDDKQNFRQILSSLSSINVVHGICILLKPNESRLTAFLEYCITELLVHLHKDAAKNIVFCFTNSLQTDFVVGETYNPLLELLDRIEERSGVHISLDLETMYCFENEPFRFLATRQQNPSAVDSSRKSPVESWEASRAESLRLIDHFKRLKPHLIEELLSVARVKRVLENLDEPLGYITSNLDENMKRIESRKEKHCRKRVDD